MSKKKYIRIFVGISVPLALLAGAVYLYIYRSPFLCPTYTLFGIYCPGCGSGRAAYELLHLNFSAAFGYNCFFVLALPFLVYELTAHYIRFVFGTSEPPSFNIGKGTIIFLIVAISAFWILRNIPRFPFTILAP